MKPCKRGGVEQIPETKGWHWTCYDCGRGNARSAPTRDFAEALLKNHFDSQLPKPATTPTLQKGLF